MAEEGVASEASGSVLVSEITDASIADETLNPKAEEGSQVSIEATVGSSALGGTESTCNDNKTSVAETTASSSEGDREKSLEFADELMDKGAKAMKEEDYDDATDYFSRALEIRVAHYGELAPECVRAYYKYGCALLYKAQEEADPLGGVPKKDGESQKGDDKDESVKNAANDESSTASASCHAEQVTSSNHQEAAVNDASSRKDQEEDDEDSDVEDLPEADEDESDLDLAWKMLDVARAIVEKHSGNTMEKVGILSALAEVALEREDIETSLSDYRKALSILEQLVEPDNRQIAELNFRISLCLEVGSKPEEAIPYCQTAISICKGRVQRLMSEVNSCSESMSSSSKIDQEQSLSGSQSYDSITEKRAEIETLTGLSNDLEKKLEDLQQLVSNPKSILSEILGMVSARARGAEKTSSSAVLSSSQMGTANSSAGFDSPTASTAHTNGSAGVTHLGVVGRGVKRVLTNTGAADSSAKKPAVEPSKNDGSGNAS